jgi:hypothetical protein
MGNNEINGFMLDPYLATALFAFGCLLDVARAGLPVWMGQTYVEEHVKNNLKST